jgi:hypothetical protein
VYSACIFCHELLGTNEHIGHFPIGRRLAFDPAKGRLWVVCRRCMQWNLTPLEERWEAVEECERAFRSVRARVSTAEIGLARMADGLDVVRIGAPLRPEFAAWRFGDQFGVRRRRAIRLGATGAGVVAGVVGAATAAVASVTLAPAILAVTAPLVFTGAIIALGVAVDRASKPYSRALHLTGDDGTRVELGHQQVLDVQMRADESLVGFHMTMDVVERDGSASSNPTLLHVTLSGAEAKRGAGLLLPRINGFGATQRSVRDAVASIEDAGSPERYIPYALSRVRNAGFAYSPIHAYPTPIRLGIEMVLHEDAERRAMEGELAELEAAWRDAERIAGIADDLVLPRHVTDFLDRHRKPGSASGAGLRGQSKGSESLL